MKSTVKTASTDPSDDAAVTQLSAATLTLIFFTTLRPTIVPAATPTTAPATSSPSVLTIDAAPEPFFDRRLIASTTGDINLRLHPPLRREVVFRFDAPWEGAESGYVTVLAADDRKFLMFYRGGGESTREQTCLAQSADGIHWTRPTVGLFEFKGSKQNNIILMPTNRKAYGESHNFTPFLDRNPATSPDHKFKALAMTRPDSRPALAAFASADAIHWTRLVNEPVITRGSFDSQNTAFWDPNLRQYACYSRIGRDGKRQIQRSLSDDFIHWSEPRSLDYGDAPLEHFYTNAITLHPANPRLYIGLPMRFVPERKKIGLPPRDTDGLSDAVVITSRDGLRFERTFREAFIRPGLDQQNWGHAHGNQTPACGILQTSPTQLSIYWSEHYGATPRLVRGTIRPGGPASIHAGADGGELLTQPLRLAGSSLHINYSTSATGSIKVELRTLTGNPLPGVAMTDCDEIYGDELDRPISWNGRTAIPEQFRAGPLRLRIRLRDIDLWAIHTAD
jgi:hypothetical protein